MKSFKKNIILISVLSLLIAGSNGCKGPENSGVKQADYPPAPRGLMQAELTKTDDTKFKLTDYKGKILLVNVWATWCGPCKQEIPDLMELQKEFKDKGLEVIGLNLDENESIDTLKEFKEGLKINYELAKGDQNLFAEFYGVSKIDAIPQSFLIDREGRLVGSFVGGGSNVRKIIEATRKLAG